MPKWIIHTSSIVGLLFGLFALWIYSSTYHPSQVEPATFACSDKAKPFNEKQTLKVLSYNIQYFAGKGYVFYYDLPNNTGPDKRPSPKSIELTLTGIVQIIREEDPDVLLIQEFHDNAKATDYEDQLAKLQTALGANAYPCTAEAFYWKADYVPLPEIMGSVGMKLGTLSKYQINKAIRHQLALIPDDPVTQQFNLKRAVLETRLASTSKAVTVMNTHLDAFAQGSTTMTEQVRYIQSLLKNLNQLGVAWIIGGDFNLLVPGEYENLPKDQQYLYNQNSELQSLWGQYQSVPGVSDVAGEDKEKWYTHYPNDPGTNGPDRIIDYVFLSDDWKVIEKRVIQGKTEMLSDHLPVQVTIKLKNAAETDLNRSASTADQ